MLYVSIFTSDRNRDPELWATIWQGQAPASLKILHVYNLMSDKRIFIWEGEAPAALMYMDRLNQVGTCDTYPAFDQTNGWIPAFAGDVEAMRAFWKGRGRSDEDIAPAIDLRSRGHLASNTTAARREAREWMAEQEARV